MEGGNFMNKLFNDYESRGTKEADLMADLKSFSDITMMKTICCYNIIVYSIISTVKNGLKVMEFYPDDIDIRNICNESFVEEHTDIITNDDFHQVGITNDLIKEIMDRGYFLKLINEETGKGTIVVPGPQLQNMITHICGAGKLSDEANPINHLYLAYLLSEHDEISLILRKVNNVAKGFAAFSDCHTLQRQDERVINILKTIRAMHPVTDVTRYRISHNKTEIEVGLSDMKTVRRTSCKKYIIVPTFFINIADTGDYASTIEAALEINGRAVKIGEPISIDADNINEMLTEEFVNFSRFLDRLTEEDDEYVNGKENIRRIMKKLGYHKIGKKYIDLYDSYIDSFPDKCSKVEVMIEVLTIPSQIIYLYAKEYKELPKYYITEKMSKISGKVFDIDFNKECF